MTELTPEEKAVLVKWQKAEKAAQDATMDTRVKTAQAYLDKETADIATEVRKAPLGSDAAETAKTINHLLGIKVDPHIVAINPVIDKASVISDTATTLEDKTAEQGKNWQAADRKASRDGENARNALFTPEIQTIFNKALTNALPELENELEKAGLSQKLGYQVRIEDVRRVLDDKYFKVEMYLEALNEKGEISVKNLVQDISQKIEFNNGLPQKQMQKDTTSKNGQNR